MVIVWPLFYYTHFRTCHHGLPGIHATDDTNKRGPPCTQVITCTSSVSDSLSAIKEIEWREEDPEKWLGSPPLVEMARLYIYIYIYILYVCVWVCVCVPLCGCESAKRTNTPLVNLSTCARSLLQQVINNRFWFLKQLSSLPPPS